MRYAMWFGVFFLAACRGGGADNGTPDGGFGDAAFLDAHFEDGGSEDALVVDASVDMPDWAADMPLRTWVKLPGTHFQTEVEQLVPSGGFVGSKPIAAILDAYADPALAEDGSAVYAFGGGHSDGSFNGVVRFDLVSLQYSLAVDPTPPDKYPPSYQAPTDPIEYPSFEHCTEPNPDVGTQCRPTYPYPLDGWCPATPGHFASDLTDPMDIPYNAPFDAPIASHMYQAAAMRGDQIYYFYGSFLRIANVTTGRWDLLQRDMPPLGELLYEFDERLGNAPFMEGIAALYDPQTDRFFIALTGGSCGQGYRSGFAVFNPNDMTFEARVGGPTKLGMTVIKAPANMSHDVRWGYVFHYGSRYQDQYMTGQAHRLNFDTLETEYLRFEGGLPESVPWEGRSEAIPVGYHAGRNSILRWDYVHEPGVIYEIDLNQPPLSGSGTSDDPYVLSEERIVLDGEPPQDPVYNYRRLYYNPVADAVVVLPGGRSEAYAFRL